METVAKVVRDRAVYLWIAFAVPALATFGHALLPEQPVLKGQDLGIVLALAGTGFAFLAWLPFRRRGAWPSFVLLFLGTVSALWLYQITRTQLDQSLFNLTAFVVPAVLLMTATKPVSRADADVAVLVLGYSLIAISAASLLFGGIGWMPSGFDVTDAGYNRLLLTEWLGIDRRWGGPFGSVNFASPIGGLLIVLGATRSGAHRWILVGSGIIILSLGQARTTMFAVVAGLLIVFLWAPFTRRLANVALVRLLVAGIALIGTFLYIIVVDPTFNGRTPIWSDFLSLMPGHILFGVGESGMLEFVGSQAGTPGFVPHTHAHSVVLDGFVRYGLVHATLAIAVFLLAVRAGVTALRQGQAASLAVVVYVIVAGLAETIHAWNYWTVYMAALVWAVIRVPKEATAVALGSASPSGSLSLPSA